MTPNSLFSKLHIWNEFPLIKPSKIAKFMGSIWGPPGSCRPQMGPMLAPRTLLSGIFFEMPTRSREILWHFECSQLHQEQLYAKRTPLLLPHKPPHLTHLPWTKWPPFRRRQFQKHFLEWRYFNFKWNFIEICSLGSSWQYVSIGLDNGLAPCRRQAIIWTSADPYHRRIYAALGGDELKRNPVLCIKYIWDPMLTPYIVILQSKEF